MDESIIFNMLLRVGELNGRMEFFFIDCEEEIKNFEHFCAWLIQSNVIRKELNVESFINNVYS